MPRPLRVQLPGYYHVTTRGNGGADIYVWPDDRRVFLAMLDRIAIQLRWWIHGWCLMTTHFHVIVEIQTENLSAGMHRLNSGYAHWFNDQHGRTGHVFERRFVAVRIESDEQLENTVRYVLNNPVKAGLCATAWDWPWLGGPMLVSARSRQDGRQFAASGSVEGTCPVPGTRHVPPSASWPADTAVAGRRA